MQKRETNARGDGERLRRQLITAASELLLAPQSVVAPSLRAVARACSVSPAAVYLHFSSQHDLLLAVVAEQLGELRASLPGLEDAAHPLAERLEDYAVQYAQWGVAHPGAYQLIFESAERLGLTEQSEWPGWDMIDAVAATLKVLGAIGAEAAQLWARRLWVALHGLVSLRIHKGPSVWLTGVEEEARSIVALHVAAVAKAGQNQANANVAAVAETEPDEWQRRVDAVWASTTERSEDDTLAAIDALVAERPAEDAPALFEAAGARDFAGREAEAEPLYRAALARGLDEPQRAQAVIQLASTLRNLGRPQEAIELLGEFVRAHPDHELRTAARAFAALARFDTGSPEEALREALDALVPQLPLYGRAVSAYAAELTERDAAPRT